MHIPLISEYKEGFIIRRLLQTLLGGPRIKLGYKAPFFIYVIQIILFLLPWCISLLFVPFIDNKKISMITAMYIFGSVIGCLVFTLQFINSFAQRETTIVSTIKSNHLLEDDEVKFSTCFGIETFQFLFPRKNNWLNIICYGVISAVMCGVSLNYLYLPPLKSWWENKTVAFFLYSFGWFTICVSQYSLAVINPPEPATFNGKENYILSATFRAFYVCIFLGVHCITWKYENWKDIDGYLHVVFVMLPVFWMLGILPPQDAFLVWISEQILCYGFGGSATVSTWVLIIMLGLLTSLTLLTYCIQNWTIITIIVSCVCYLLNVNLVEHIFNKAIKRFSVYFCKNETIVSVLENQQNGSLNTQFKQFLFHISMIALSGVVAWSSSWIDMNTEMYFTIWKISGALMILTVIIIWLLGQLQKVYMFGGIVRNRLYPANNHNVSSFKEQKKKLSVFHYLRTTIRILMPLLMIFFLSIFGRPKTSDQMCFLLHVAIVRTFCQAWQHTENTYIDMSLVYIICEHTSLLTDHSVPLLIGLLCAGIARDRLIDTWNKLYVVIIITATSICNKKQRLRHIWLLLGLDIIFLPVILIFILLSIGLSAPLVSLFTLPVFLPGFPRPIKFWSGQISPSTNGSVDSVYYQQMVPSLVRGLQTSLSRGSLGFVSSGDFFLTRFQDRLLWLQVLERGFDYCKVCIKGLELQETSCHAIEASKVDEIFEQAFETEKEEKLESYKNLNIFNTLVPCDIVITRTYSDARNVLTGIIHSTDTLNMIREQFSKIMTWLLVNFVITSKKESQSTIQKPSKSNLESFSESDVVRSFSRQSANEISRLQNLQIQTSEKVSNRSDEKWAVPVRSSSTLSSWPDDDDPLDSDSDTACAINEIKKNSTAKEITKQLKTIIPGIPNESIGNTCLNAEQLERRNSYIYFPPSPLTPPKQWLSFPSGIDLHKNDVIFSEQWFYKVVRWITQEKEDIEKLLDDKNIVEIYEKLVTLGYQVIYYDHYNILGHDHVYKSFIGVLSPSTVQEWLISNEELHKIVLTAYRYSVKLALDQLLIGPIDSDRSFHEYLQDCINCWHIGIDGDEAWKNAILNNCSYLFSIGYNHSQNVYTSHLLTLEEYPVYVGSLNSALVHSIWSSLCIELLYLTNDDDERYSIQADPTILRNLTIQAANPPLGYPAFCSRPILISTL